MILRLVLALILLPYTISMKINAQTKEQPSKPFPHDMPLILYPSSSKDSLPLMFFISGDGGWASFNKNISETLARRGMPVVGLDSRKYYWKFKTPQEASAKIAQAINHYLKLWNRSHFVLVGYSFGAGVVPFIANHFPESLKKSLKVLFCFSPSEKTDFEVHLSDMIKIENPSDTFSVADELKTSNPYKVICIFGDEEDSKIRAIFMNTKVQVMTIPGKHDFNDDFAKFAEVIETQTQLNKY